ncbi:Protein CBG12894 [Caenorhabditis briggsae]|uniref:Protein CBG12894 n=1 Tax=Caenorhabditis briggsae TaxID=6238 RepID=A8XGL8_CAEBR|nr:Protein CBG12894 [Caenorhabditis briggsae]CAP31792.2 Protein CBG12894 [Caenorhabditis briggsae]
MLPYSEKVLGILLESETPLFFVLILFLFLFKVCESDQKLKVLYQEKEELLRILWENDKEKSKVDSEDSEEDDSDYQLPYVSDSEVQENSLLKQKAENIIFFNSKKVTQRNIVCHWNSSEEDESGYNTDPDREWELYKIYHAPAGPVPLDKIYLTFTCQFTDLYVKAVVDADHSLIYILSYDRNENNQWEWMETKCLSCIEKVRRVLADGGCTVPFAMDAPDVMESESDDDDVISVIEMPIGPRLVV